MNPLLIVFCAMLTYGIFIVIAYKLSKILFPKPKGDENPFERSNSR